MCFSEMLVNLQKQITKNAQNLLYVFIYWRRILYQETSSEINRRLPYALINASDKVNSTFDRLKKLFLVFTSFSVTKKNVQTVRQYYIDRHCFFIFKEKSARGVFFRTSRGASGNKNWNFVYWQVYRLLVTLVQKLNV